MLFNTSTKNKAQYALLNIERNIVWFGKNRNSLFQEAIRTIIWFSYWCQCVRLCLRFHSFILSSRIMWGARKIL